MKFAAHQFTRVEQMLEPASYVAAAELFSASIDCRGYDELLIVVNVGVATATGDVTMIVEDSADDVTFADIDLDADGVDDATFAEIALANDQTVFVGRINCASVRRYVRVGYDVDDDAVIFGITGVLLHPKYAPSTQVNAVAFNVDGDLVE